MRAGAQWLPEHRDVIHDIAYDFYGKRIATASSDQHIKVWNVSSTGEWQLAAEWKAHSGSIWKLSWAHPEYGQVLAACSFDRTVTVWEETESAGPAGEPISTWLQRAQLVDSKNNVIDVEFAPRHHGLRVAAASVDGHVRIYEAVDVMNLSHWSLMEEFETGKGGSTCISWNTSKYDPPMLAEGNPEKSVKIWQYNDVHRKWMAVHELVDKERGEAITDVAWAPNMGREFHLIAAASKDQTVSIWKIDSQRLERLTGHGSEVWRVSWNITGTVLASSADDGKVRLWKANPMGQWQCVSLIIGDEGDQ